MSDHENDRSDGAAPAVPGLQPNEPVAAPARGVVRAAGEGFSHVPAVPRGQSAGGVERGGGDLPTLEGRENGAETRPAVLSPEATLGRIGLMPNARILTRPEARAYVKRNSEYAFHQWCKRYHVTPASRGRYSITSLDRGLDNEARGQGRRKVA